MSSNESQSAAPRQGHLASPLVFGGTVFVATCVLMAVIFHLLDDPADVRPAGELPEAQDALVSHRPRPTSPPAELTGTERRRVAVVRESARSVVHIRARQDEAVLRDRVRYEGMDPSLVPSGTGSGIIWNDRGYIVTNAHLVDGQTDVTVQLGDGSRWKADYVGVSLATDLAVICIGAPAESLVPIRLGNAQQLVVGQSVYALGNPFGLDLSLTTGVVSGLGRETTTPVGAVLRSVIQTDAAINPGNSGGPLLDSSGAMIGLNTSIPAQTRTSGGIGFALPVELINQVVPRIIEEGIEPRWELGLKLAADAHSRQLLAALQLEGVVLLAVEAGSPAELRLGALLPHGDQVQLGDVIVGVNGTPTPDRSTLAQALDLIYRSSDPTVSLDIVRQPTLYQIGRRDDGSIGVEQVLRQAPRKTLTVVLIPEFPAPFRDE